MKITGLFITLMIGFISLNSLAQEALSPYFKVADLTGNIEDANVQITNIISTAGFEVIGEYDPAEKQELKVICFTNNELKKLSLQFADRGALASVLKAALVKENDKITVSILNPEYMFLAYWGEQLVGQEGQLDAMSDKVINAFSKLGKLEPYGGFEKRDDLPDYHYMMMMPYFSDPVELNEFSSFEEGLKTIRKNLEAKTGSTVKVFEQVFDGKEIAVFGVGLWDKETGEGAFLPTIGEGHIANLPYEIILQGKMATMLHGKYRIALYWPELKMGTFMKISSTPGEIEDTMKALCGAE
jgi:hypothetical protein